MATGDGIYTSFKGYCGSASMDMANNVFKVILLNTSHTFNAAHQYYADISANELATAGGYTAGGAALAGKTWAAVSTTYKWDGTDQAWTSATFTAYFAAIFNDTVANDPLVCSFGFGGAQTVAAGTFTIQWNASGILVLS